MSIAEYAIKRKLITLVFTFLLIVGGYDSFHKLGSLEDPEFTIKDALIVTRYPGASPLEVEEEVTDEIEKAVQQLSQLDEVNSISKKGLSIVTVTIKDKYDKHTLPQVWDELRRKVGDAQSKLPPGCLKPVINDDYGDVFGILFAVSGEGYTYREIKDYVDFLERELLLVPGVGKVSIDGAQQEAIYIEISKNKMAQLGVSLELVYKTMNTQNFVVPAGNVHVSGEYIRIAPTGEFKSVEQIGDLVIRGLRSDRLISLRDIADIKREEISPPTRLIRFNGKNAITVGISVVPGGNVVDMGNGVKKRLAELESERPVGMELGTISFQSDSVSASIAGFVVNLGQAIAIVIIVLLVFMGFRSGMIIGAVLLITVCASLILMKLWDINMQRISLGALIISLGMLVDNAIVVTEGMLIKIQNGEDRLKAAKDVVMQTMWPLFGATVIAVLAFAAIGVSQDATGEFCRSLFQVILISLMMSWVTAITVTPLLCHMFLKSGESSGENSNAYDGKFFNAYRSFLRFTINFKWATIVFLAFLLILSMWGFTKVEVSFFPDSTRPQFSLHLWMAEGTDLRVTSKELAKVEAELREDKRVKNVASFIGRGASRFMLTYTPEKSYESYGLLLIEVHDYREINDIAKSALAMIAEKYPHIQPKIEKIQLGPSGGSKIEARFSGENPDVLRQLSEQAKKIIREDGGAVCIKDDWRQRVKVLRPMYTEALARRLGVYRPHLCMAMESAFDGRYVGLYREGDDLLPVIARSPENERRSVNNIFDAQVWSPITGKAIPVSQIVAKFKVEWEDAIINRLDRKRTITVQCDQKTGNASVLFKRLRGKIEAIPLPDGYVLEWGGEFESSGKAQKALAKNLPMTFLLMVLIIIVLFNSLRKPAVIILTVPLAIIGVTVGLLSTSQPFGFMALLGFLSLVGMLIKNAIVLIDEVNVLLGQGMDDYEAVVLAAVSRVRPVSMAAVTTILGMLPLLSDAFFISMAVTIMAGLAFATVLTLVVVPVLYAAFFGLKV